MPSVSDVENIIDTWLETLQSRGLETVEVSFFGGSFTGIPMEEQKKYLQVAYAYKTSGRIDKIHMSTRPDYISREILDMLKEYTVDTIELGVQSFDDDVLTQCRRGHTADDVYAACDLIKEYGMELGIQLMIGLPGDTKEKAVLSAEKAAKIGPSLARLYPTVVLPDTELAEMLKDGRYTPLDESETIEITKEMYKILMAAGINIMRVGLKSTDLVTSDTDLAGSYHPAFRQIVEGEICREQMLDLLGSANSRAKIQFLSNEKWFPPMIGHKACNKKFFSERFPDIEFEYAKAPALKDGVISIL